MTLPDLNKRGKQVWMLPNLSSFTNIYARINLFNKKKLASVRLVYDTQLELDDILAAAKRMAESFKKAGLKPYTPFSDFSFDEAAALEFKASHESVGIQLADILAGTIMRFFRDERKGSSQQADKLTEELVALLVDAAPLRGIGVNQLVPTRLVVNKGPHT